MKRLFLFVLLIVLFSKSDAQIIKCKISGSKFLNLTDIEGIKHYYYTFDGAQYPDMSTLFPIFGYRKVLQDYQNEDYAAEILNPVFEDFNPEELSKTDLARYEQETIDVRAEIKINRGQAELFVSLKPYRYNSKKAVLEKLIAFELKITKNPSNFEKKKKIATVQNSILASGKWIKINIYESGMYRLTFDQLRNIGIDNPQNLRIFGNATGLLSYKNSDSRPDDLTENKISIADNQVIFYAQGPDRWDFNVSYNLFVPIKNIYSDHSSYFLTSDINTGYNNSVSIQNNNSLSENVSVDNYNSYGVHNMDLENICRSGRVWYGEIFDATTEYTIELQIPDIQGIQSKIKFATAAASKGASSSFKYRVGNLNNTITLPTISGDYQYASRMEVEKTFTPTSGNSLSVTFEFLKAYSAAKGWLDYVYVNTFSSLNYSGKHFSFRNLNSVGAGKISKFTISNAVSGLRIWDISDRTTPIEISGTISNNILSFKSPTDDLREFCAFTLSDLKTPDLSSANVSSIQNQNLHSLSGSTDFIIISAPEFLEQAHELENFREQNDGLNVFVTTPQEIYNEYSSGSPDISALRDFVRNVYQKPVNGNTLKYLLLFGDGSYNNMTQSSSNTNFIPTYQSENSENDAQSYVTDDFFGLLDDTEGPVSGSLDIGIGRFPVDNTTQAQGVVDKIISYANAENMKEWRNRICFFADDADEGQPMHMHDADSLTRVVAANNPNLNIEKVYFDAYPQEITSGGERYPEVNQQFINQFTRGNLIINYTGHGGERGLAHERVLTISEIENLHNPNNYPLFVTATCEFSRFDDFEYISGGERTFLNPQGGAIAMLTTTRVVYIYPNFVLNKSFYNSVFKKDINGEYLRLGEVLRLTKNNADSGTNKLNFTLLGDPSMKLNIPEYQIKALMLNDNPINLESDTIKSLSKITISGEVQDLNGQKMSDFNGFVYPSIYDKSKDIKTLDNEGEGVFEFPLRNSTLYRGKTRASGGEFSFTFITPKDIMQNIDFGKISLYAENGKIDAAGNNFDIRVGGFSENYISDTQGPEIKLFLNDSNFVSGGICDENPNIFAKLRDENGINTTGSGIGHDIVAVVDAEGEAQTFVLNDAYTADADSYQSGEIFQNLATVTPGRHTLSLKAWDVFNNSSQVSIDFIVLEGNEISISNLVNYPNPVVDETNFYFEHNRTGADMKIEIEIYNFNGQLVKTLSQTLFAEGYRTGPIVWDGTGQGGSRLQKGMYIYTVKISSEAGGTAQKSQKLLLIKSN